MVSNTVIIVERNQLPQKQKLKNYMDIGSAMENV